MLALMSGVTAARVLGVLSKARLGQLARDLSISLPEDAQKATQISKIAQVQLKLEALLPRLTRDELRAACKAHELTHKGRSRAELMSRLGVEIKPAAPDLERQIHQELGLPFPGNIAVVRHRQYMVTDVQMAPVPGQQTLVKLVCLDDDAAGKELHVFWERELGARVIKPEDKGLGAIEKLDSPRHFAAYLHALKWNAVTSTDTKLFQSPFRAGIKLMRHQLVPLMKALELPRVNLFIADDVGLGKTIEAGLVMQELLLRQRIDQLLIVCPASVCLQWQGEMEKRFGLRFEIYNRAFVGKRRQERGFGVNAWATYPRFIISLQTIRRPEYRDLLLAHLGDRAKRSMLIVDEAHNAAPSSATKYAVDSSTTRVIRDIAPRFEHRLFLSATPHNGHSNSFSSLLEILDPQRFTRGVPVHDKKVLNEVMIRRLKRDIKAIEISDHYPNRHVIPIRLLAADPEAAKTTWVAQNGNSQQLGDSGTADLVLAEMLRQYASVAEVKGKRGRLAIVNLQKRLLSSVEAFARTLRRHAKTVAPDLEAAEEQVLELSTDFACLDEEYGSEDDSEAEDSRADSHAVVAPPNAKKLLADMIDLAERHRDAASPKVLSLVGWMQANQCSGVAIGGVKSKAKKADKKWTDTRVLIFTEYADTKRWLRHQLNAATLGSDKAELRIMEFHGGMSDEQREEVQRAFNGPPDEYPVRILLATDAAREGVNLQGYCANLFHFDVPWNPGRLEQRNGRIDRTLQRASDVYCHYFIYPQRVEDRVLDVLITKVDRIQRELGSLGMVIAEQLSEALQEGIDDQSLAKLDEAESLGGAVEQFIATAQEELESFTETNRHRTDIEEAGRILDRSRNVANFGVEHLRNAINVGLEMAGTTSMKADPEQDGQYTLPQMPTGWDQTLDTLRAPRLRVQEFWEWRNQPLLPVVFKSPEAMTSDVSHLHLHHPFVQRILGRFMAQGYAANDLSRVTVVVNDQDSQTRVIAFGRLTIYGYGANRLHEELIAVSARWLEGRGELKPYAEESDRKALERLESLLTTSPNLTISGAAQATLCEMAPSDFSSLWPHVKAEEEARRHDAELKLKARGSNEAEQLRQILQRQRKAIQNRLGGQQMPLFPDAKSEAQNRQVRQHKEDMRHMERRLGEMVHEIEREPARVEKSYQPTLHRLEPVGLVYLWPSNR